VASQSDLITWSSNSIEIKGVVVSDGIYVQQNEKLEKLQVFSFLRNWEKILDFIVFVDVLDRPVGMFSTSINFLERFFMEKNYVSLFIEGFLKDFHGDQVMEDSFSSILIHGTELKLVVSNLVMSCLEWNTDLQQLSLNFFQDFFNDVRHFTNIMVTELLISLSNVSD